MGDVEGGCAAPVHVEVLDPLQRAEEVRLRHDAVLDERLTEEEAFARAAARHGEAAEVRVAMLDDLIVAVLRERVRREVGDARVLAFVEAEAAVDERRPRSRQRGLLLLAKPAHVQRRRAVVEQHRLAVRQAVGEVTRQRLQVVAEEEAFGLP